MNYGFMDRQLTRREREMSGTSSDRWRMLLNTGTSLGETAKLCSTLAVFTLFPMLVLARIFDAFHVSQLYFRVPLIIALTLFLGILILSSGWYVMYWVRRGIVGVDALIEVVLFTMTAVVLVWILFALDWVPAPL